MEQVQQTSRQTAAVDVCLDGQLGEKDEQNCDSASCDEQQLMLVLSRVHRAYNSPSDGYCLDSVSQFAKRLEAYGLWTESVSAASNDCQNDDCSANQRLPSVVQHQHIVISTNADSCRGTCRRRDSSLDRPISVPPFLRPIEEESTDQEQTVGQTVDHCWNEHLNADTCLLEENISSQHHRNLYCSEDDDTFQTSGVTDQNVEAHRGSDTGCRSTVVQTTTTPTETDSLRAVSVLPDSQRITNHVADCRQIENVEQTMTSLDKQSTDLADNLQVMSPEDVSDDPLFSDVINRSSDSCRRPAEHRLVYHAVFLSFAVLLSCLTTITPSYLVLVIAFTSLVYLIAQI